MRYFKLVFLIVIFTTATTWPRKAYNENNKNLVDTNPRTLTFNNYLENFYRSLEDSSISYDAFSLGLKGYYNLSFNQMLDNDQFLTIIDYSLPSDIPRFFLVDLQKKQISHKTLVSHGKNSGQKFAFEFSNQPNSYKSSIGFFLTQETYIGKHGYSMRLEGLEKNINDNARSRDIVIHAAEYASIEFINKLGFLGRSLGCPALPVSCNSEIIEIIKECSCLFIFYPDTSYFKSSTILNDLSFQEVFEWN